MGRLTIADTMELEDVLDFIPEGKRAEAVSFLVSVYGLDNHEHYFNIKDFVDEYELEPEYTTDDIYRDYSLQELYGADDCCWAYGEELLEHFTNHQLMRNIRDEDLIDEVTSRVVEIGDEDLILECIENMEYSIEQLKKELK